MTISYDPISSKLLVQGYADMVIERIELGFMPYLLTFMFHALAGKPASVARQMEHEIERVYAKCLTRVFRNPANIDILNLPMWIVCPDYPVPKHEKSGVTEIALNDGRHAHAIGLMPTNSRMRGTLDEHFEERQDLYAGPGRAIARVHAKPITFSPAYAMEYALKSLSRGRTNSDDMLILPRTYSEM